MQQIAIEPTTQINLYSYNTFYDNHNKNDRCGEAANFKTNMEKRPKIKILRNRQRD